jgi:hypothetical protein
MSACPRCGRPLAVARPRCLYCGAGRAAVSGPADAGEPPSHAAAPRALLVLDVAGAGEDALAAALRVSRFEARQLQRRGGFQLQRVADKQVVEREAGELLGHGLAVTVLDEAAVQAAAAPLVARKGRLDGATLALRIGSDNLGVEKADVLLGVRGPIRREYQTAANWRRLRSATLSDGYRFHLHRHSDPRPVELDPGAFEFDEEDEAFQSSLLRLNSWFATLTAHAAVDDAFRLLTPALGAEAADEAGVFKLAEAARPARPKGEPLVLDNLRQFRFYSAWRGTLERGLRRPGG